MENILLHNFKTFCQLQIPEYITKPHRYYRGNLFLVPPGEHGLDCKTKDLNLLLIISQFLSFILVSLLYLVNTCYDYHHLETIQILQISSSPGDK